MAAFAFSTAVAQLLLAVSTRLAFAGQAAPGTAVVNPANQQAIQTLQRSIQLELAPNPTFLTQSCGANRGSYFGVHFCAINDTQGAIVENMRVQTRSHRPAAVSCSALPGYTFTCTLSGGSMQIDGDWFIGQYSFVSGRPRYATTFARGRFTLTVRDYNPTWTGTFLRGYEQRSNTTWHDTIMNCDKTDPIPPGAHFAIGITRTAGSESPEVTPAIERLAREAVVFYFCSVQQRVRNRNGYLNNLGTDLRSRMTWLQRDNTRSTVYY